MLSVAHLSVVEIRLSLLHMLALLSQRGVVLTAPPSKIPWAKLRNKSRYHGGRIISAALLMFTHCILEFAVILVICIGTFFHLQRSVAYISHQ